MLDKKCFEMIRLANKEEKIAWIVRKIIQQKGRGIVVCFSDAECETVRKCLEISGIGSGVIDQQLSSNVSAKQEMEMKEVRDSFMNGRINILFTVFHHAVDLSDYQDLTDYMIFYQKPVLYGNLESIYKMCFCAKKGQCFILDSKEKAAIKQYFMEKCANEETIQEILNCLQNSRIPLTEKEFQIYINKSSGEIRYSLYLLEKERLVFRDGTKYCYLGGNYNDIADKVRAEQQKIFQQEQQMMQFCDEIGTSLCKADALFFELLEKVHTYFKNKTYEINTRKMWPAGFQVNGKGKIEYPYQKGIAFAEDAESGMGSVIERDFQTNNISEELMNFIAGRIKNMIQQNNIRWITYVEEADSLGSMKRFAEKLGEKLGVFVAGAITLNGEGEQSKNTIRECCTISQMYQLDISNCYKGNVLLLKKHAGSRYALTYCSNMLGNVGCGNVYVCTLLLEE